MVDQQQKKKETKREKKEEESEKGEIMAAKTWTKLRHF